jgi:putative hemolysin
MDPFVYVPLFIAVILSFWISLVEATYLTVRPAPLRLASESGNRRADVAIRITNEKTRLISTTTFVDTFSNVVIATTAGIILSSSLGAYGWIISAIFGSLLIMIFLYLIPKAIGIENSFRMAITLSHSSDVLLRVLSPIAVPLTSFAGRLSGRFIVDRAKTDSRTLVNEFEDFLILLERAGHVAPDAGKVIRSALSSTHSLAKDFLTPAQEIVSIEDTSTVEQALKLMGQSSHPHVPIRNARLKTYVGAVTFSSLCPAMANGRFSDSVIGYAVEPARVSVDDPAVAVMDRMEHAQVTMAFVYQEDAIAGMITLTDILEVILGMKV